MKGYELTEMKLVVFGPKRLGALLEDGSIVDLNRAYEALLADDGVPGARAKASAKVPTCLLAFIEEGEKGLKAAAKAIEYVKNGATKTACGQKLLYKGDKVKIHAPLPSLASRITMAGANFFDHSAGMTTMMSGKQITKEELKKQHAEEGVAVWGFWKHARNVVSPGGTVTYPASTDRLDYEVEVAAVIGKKGKDIPEEEAMDHVYGYTIVRGGRPPQAEVRPQRERRGQAGRLPRGHDTGLPLLDKPREQRHVPLPRGHHLRGHMRGHGGRHFPEGP
jgi:acylpyruvate hydrolase